MSKHCDPPLKQKFKFWIQKPGPNWVTTIKNKNGLLTEVMADQVKMKEALFNAVYILGREMFKGFKGTALL